jgi:hypothetical protein
MVPTRVPDLMFVQLSCSVTTPFPFHFNELVIACSVVRPGVLQVNTSLSAPGETAISAHSRPIWATRALGEAQRCMGLAGRSLLGQPTNSLHSASRAGIRIL